MRRADADRSRRFADHAAADTFDAGRPRVAPWIVDVLLERMDLVIGDQVVEIDAGTGQLTLPLASAGLRVHALEPARPLAARLQRNATARGASSVAVHASPFATFDSTARVDAVVTAGYPDGPKTPFSFARAADLLVDDGALGVVAHHVRLRDAALQWRLNHSVFRAPLEDVRGDPERTTNDAVAALASQRGELAATGAFGAPWWSLTARRERWSRERYGAFVAGQARSADLQAVVEERLAATRLPETIAVTDYVYIAVARRLRRS